jgi:asparagine synthase (glutamine-hydrolysing)
MCGIAGFWGDFSSAPEARETLSRMTSTLAHRGPDAQGTWIGVNVGLGHTRLAIIDALGGAQPMQGGNGRYTTVFNGEIYNFKQLKGELAGLGYRFATNSDTEVIWAAIEAWGVDKGLRSFQGMFAFALYDAQEQSLLIARDRVGIKPVFWAESAGTVLFASEPKAILEAGLVERRINPVAIHDYLAHGYSATPDTSFAGIQQLEPGSWRMFRKGSCASGRYWQWEITETYAGNASQATDLLRETLENSIRSHMVSDVSVGTFLSGGLDSSLITALLANSVDRPKTFSVGFGDRSHDESDAARAVSKHFGTHHHELRLEVGDGDPDLLRTIVQQYDEPFGDSSCIPTYLMCREVSKHIKVVLSGDGGDEVLGGYVRYVNAQRLGAFASMNGSVGWLGPLLNAGTGLFGRAGARVRKAWELSRMSSPARLCALQNYLSEDDRRSLYKPAFERAALAQGPTLERFARLVPSGVANPVQQLIGAEMRLRLHADYLRKVDVASSAHGLEVRVPFLDNSMLDFGASLPVQLKVTSRGETKFLARRLAQQVLPLSIARRPKQGFSLPLDSWAGHEMRTYFRELLLGPQSRSSALLDRRAVEQTWRAFDEPSGDPTISRYQRYQRVFLLVSLELWMRRWRPSVA